MLCPEHWKPPLPLAPATMPLLWLCRHGAICQSSCPLGLDLRSRDGAALGSIRSHTVASSPVGSWTAFRPSGTALPPTCACLGEQGLYLLVQERVPPQEALLPAQQHPVLRLGFSPAAGLGYLVAIQSQESKNGCKLEVFGPVDPTATELEEQREGSGGELALRGRGGRAASLKGTERKRDGTESRHRCGLAPPHSTCVTLGKSLSFSEPPVSPSVKRGQW